jgi:hypothetical protein
VPQNIPPEHSFQGVAKTAIHRGVIFRKSIQDSVNLRRELILQ